MIDINKKYQTRSGLPIRIFMIDGGGNFPTIGAYQHPNKFWTSSRWTQSGSYNSNSSEDDLDLVEVPHFSVGQRVKTKDGKDAIIVEIRPHSMSVVIRDNGSEGWTAYNRYLPDGTHLGFDDNSYDLVTSDA